MFCSYIVRVDSNDTDIYPSNGPSDENDHVKFRCKLLGKNECSSSNTIYGERDEYTQYYEMLLIFLQPEREQCNIQSMRWAR